jgi:2-haloacid dehalogenase
MGANKPTKEFFDRAMSVIGDIRPSEMVMIGDSLTADVSGAKAYGYHTIWFDKYGVGVGNEADFVVTKLTDIIDIFRSNYE